MGITGVSYTYAMQQPYLRNRFPSLPNASQCFPMLSNPNAQ